MAHLPAKNNQTTKNDSAEKSSDINSSSNAVTEAVQNNTDNEKYSNCLFFGSRRMLTQMELMQIPEQV